MIVSSVAPPMSRSRLVRTVTRARTFNSTPFLAMALSVLRCELVGVGAVDHLGIDAGLHGFQHVAPGQVDGRRLVEVEIQVGAVGGDDRADHVGHVAAGQVVGLQTPRGDARLPLPPDARLHRHDLALHDHPGVDLAEAHADQAQMLTLALDM